MCGKIDAKMKALAEASKNPRFSASLQPETYSVETYRHLVSLPVSRKFDKELQLPLFFGETERSRRETHA